MFKRMFLFLATNMAVLALVSIVMSILGVNPQQFGGLLIMARYLIFTDSNIPTLIGLGCILGGLYTATKWR